jgi:hypothetical protein
VVSKAQTRSEVGVQIIKLGSTGADVERWQYFLIGQGFCKAAVSGRFDPEVDAATKRYQRARGMMADGVVGNATLNAATSDGFPLFATVADSTNRGSSNWPPRPTNIHVLSEAERKKLFGTFKFTAAPTGSNPEAIKIEAGWTAANIVQVDVPVVCVVPTKVTLHKLAKDPFIALLEAWDKAKLLDHILTWNGSYVPRFKRGSDTSLSNHSWGTAFDINVADNGLGATPALVGQPGSVRELVPIANKLGWYWGGHFASRLDGMHFELVQA